MDYLHNHKSLRAARKELRKNMTPQESIIWAHVRNKKLGCKFYRQYSLGPYIVDFYCSSKKLIIEIDGNQHWQAQEYDEERTRFFNSLGYQLIRFNNSEIDQNLSAVMGKIASLCSPPM